MFGKFLGSKDDADEAAFIKKHGMTRRAYETVQQINSGSSSDEETPSSFTPKKSVPQDHLSFLEGLEGASNSQPKAPARRLTPKEHGMLLDELETSERASAQESVPLDANKMIKDLRASMMAQSKSQPKAAPVAPPPKPVAPVQSKQQIPKIEDVVIWGDTYFKVMSVNIADSTITGQDCGEYYCGIDAYLESINSEKPPKRGDRIKVPNDAENRLVTRINNKTSSIVYANDTACVIPIGDIDRILSKGEPIVLNDEERNVRFPAEGDIVTVAEGDLIVSSFDEASQVVTATNDDDEEVKIKLCDVDEISEAADDDDEETLTCPQCGTECPGGAKFCSNCGTAMPKALFCAECGKEVPTGAKFCSNCGAKSSST